MKKLSIAIAILILLTFAFTACTKYAAEPTEDEMAVIHRSLGADASAYIVYDRSEAAAYLLGAADNGYVIMKRSNSMICEEGEKNPYADHMELKKYYGEIFTYIVYDPSTPETPFHNLTLDTYGASYSDVAKKK